MPFAAHRAAPQIEQEINGHQQLMNNNRYAPPMLDSIKKVSEQSRVYIFNVGPWPQQRYLGSLGMKLIPACPEGKPYSEPLVVEGIVRELYPINEGEYKQILEDGVNVAQQILGVGPHLSPRNSFVPYGVFVSTTDPPNEADLKKARAALRDKFLELVTEADSAYSLGPKTAEDTIRPETHFVAARALGKTEVDCPWLRNAQVPAERAECPGCGTVYKIGIMKCRECGYILDKKKYEANKANFAA